MTPDDVALEHCTWAKAQGLTPTDVCASIGVNLVAPDWSDAMRAVSNVERLARARRSLLSASPASVGRALAGLRSVA